MRINDPFILRSEHERILGSAQQRYDEKLDEQFNLGYLSGRFVGVVCGLALTTILGLVSLGRRPRRAARH